MQERKLKIFHNSKDDEEEANDYMCIQYKIRPDSKSTRSSSYPSFVRNVWVGHAVALYISVDEEKDVDLKFRIQHHNSPPPPELLSSHMDDVVNCTVEFLTKGLSDR